MHPRSEAECIVRLNNANVELQRVGKGRTFGGVGDVCGRCQPRGKVENYVAARKGGKVASDVGKWQVGVNSRMRWRAGGGAADVEGPGRDACFSTN